MAILGTALTAINAILFMKSSVRNNRAFKIFTVYLVIIAIIEVTTIVVAKVFHQSNLFLSHFYFGVQFILLSTFYSVLLKQQLIKYLLFAVLAFVCYQFIDDPSLFHHYNPIGTSLMQGLIVIYSLLYFYKCLSGKTEFVIVNIGIFLYLLSSALIFITGNLVLDLDISEKTSYLLINVNRVLIVVFQILIFVEWRNNYSRTRIRS